MNNQNRIIAVSDIQNRIFTMRGVQVMLDRDLAEMYGVGTKVLNQAVKRNLERFPEVFRFQLDDREKHELVTICDRFKNLKHSSVNPYAFTEQGVAMLSAVLRSETAVKVSIRIMEAFVEMRRFLAVNATLFQRLENVERKQLETDRKIEEILDALGSKSIEPKQGIFYDGQVFDAHVFVSGLIRTAEKSILLIDNYIDERVLALLAKRRDGVKATILTRKISPQLKLDLEKHNAQYPPIEIKEFDRAHDRFLIIDDKDVYHFGASLKDLGKKWFAFSKIDIAALDILNRIKGNDNE